MSISQIQYLLEENSPNPYNLDESVDLAWNSTIHGDACREAEHI